MLSNVISTGGISLKHWRTQDWIWLLGYLVYAQGLIVLKEEMVMTVLSYVSTFVSISLAGVAIYISVREVTKGDKVKDQINVMLGELREKLSQMDTKLNNFDPQKFNQDKDHKIDAVIEKINADIEGKLASVETISKDDIMKMVSQQVHEASDELKSTLTIKDSSTSYGAQKRRFEVLLSAEDGVHAYRVYEKLRKIPSWSGYPVDIHTVLFTGGFNVGVIGGGDLAKNTKEQLLKSKEKIEVHVDFTVSASSVSRLPMENETLLEILEDEFVKVKSMKTEKGYYFF